MAHVRGSAEEETLQVAARKQFLGAAFEDDLAKAQTIGTMRDAQDVAHLLLDDENGDAGLAVDLADLLEDSPDEVGSKAKRWFVEHEELRLRD